MKLQHITTLLKCKYIFLPPKKSELLIYDEHSHKITSGLLNLQKVQILKTRKEEINLFILLKTLLNLKFSFFDYLIQFIKYTNAKIVITSIDNNDIFYKIKKKCSVSTIFFQNGVRMGYRDIFEIFHQRKKFSEIKKQNHVDLMCTFNLMTSHLYSKIVNGKTIVSGSVLSNNVKISNKKKNGLIYISLFRPSMKRKTHLNEIKLIKSLHKYCLKNKLTLKILFKYFKKTKNGQEEKNFYRNILDKNFKGIPNSNKRNSYRLIDDSKIVVSPGSTMGIESLGRKNKTAIINPFPNVHPIKRNFFGYFTKRKKSGFFWHNGIEERKVFKVLDNVKNVNSKDWNKLIAKYKYETAKYDKKNVNLKKILNEFFLSHKIKSHKYLRK